MSKMPPTPDVESDGASAEAEPKASSKTADEFFDDLDDPEVSERRGVLEQEMSSSALRSGEGNDDEDGLQTLHDGVSAQQRLRWRTRRAVCALGAVLLALIGVFAVLAIVFSLQEAPEALEQCTVEVIPVPEVSNMTLEEKVGQMMQVSHLQLRKTSDVAAYFIGSVLSGGGGAPVWGNEAKNWADMTDDLQQKTKRTRLRIPLVYAADAVHGHNNVLGATIFPHHVGQGAARDPALVQQIAALTAKEVAATGVRWAFAPCVAVCQDPRWGRCYESFSAGPSIVTLLALPEILGFQQFPEDSDTRSLPADSIFVAATAKHFVGDGGTRGGKDRGDTVCSEEELHETHLAPYDAAVLGGVSAIMASYSSWNGVPMHKNRYLLTELLREDFGFPGVVVSDWGAVQLLPGDAETQIADAINAGIDVVMAPDDYATFAETLVDLVKRGLVNESRIDEAVGRVLGLKKSLGLFKNACAQREFLELVGADEHRQVAREAVRSSLVLLKNRLRSTGDDAATVAAEETAGAPLHPVFPFNPDGQKLLVVGRHADDIGLQCGGWTITWQGGPGRTTQGTTIVDGIRRACHEIAPETADVVYQETYDGSTRADLGLIVLGEDPYAEYSGDSQTLALNETDVAQIEQVCSNMACVLVLISGRPLHVTPFLDKLDGLVAAWLPGSEGTGVADVLIGEKHDFTGRLPMHWFKDVSQLPLKAGDGDIAQFSEGFGLNKRGVPIGT